MRGNNRLISVNNKNNNKCTINNNKNNSNTIKTALPLGSRLFQNTKQDGAHVMWAFLCPHESYP
jgi:hypothetical protein